MWKVPGNWRDSWQKLSEKNGAKHVKFQSTENGKCKIGFEHGHLLVGKSFVDKSTSTKFGNRELASVKLKLGMSISLSVKIGESKS